MKEKINCPTCKLIIDKDCKFCPYCGENLSALQEQNIQKLDTQSLEKDPSAIKSEPKVESRSGFFDYEPQIAKLPLIYSFVLLLVGIAGVTGLGTIFQLLAKSGNFFYQHSVNFSASVNFASYFVLFGIIVAIIAPQFTKILDSIKTKKGRLFGLFFGFALLLITSAVSSVFNLIPHAGVNDNESSIQAISSSYPVLSIIVFGFLGPICEEFTYRVGLFSLIRKRRRVPAYIITCLVFGLIHFNFGSSDIVNELINIPSYIVAGLLLCYFYEYKGLSASIIAHVINNLFAIILPMILSMS